MKITGGSGANQRRFPVTGAEVVADCPSIGKSSALAALKKLTAEGPILRQGSGRSTYYLRADSTD